MISTRAPHACYLFRWVVGGAIPLPQGTLPSLDAKLQTKHSFHEDYNICQRCMHCFRAKTLQYTHHLKFGRPREFGAQLYRFDVALARNQPTDENCSIWVSCLFLKSRRTFGTASGIVTLFVFRSTTEPETHFGFSIRIGIGTIHWRVEPTVHQ